MVDSDLSSGSSSSSSSDSVLIRVPLDQKRRKKLRAQLQEDQRRQRERQSSFAASPSQKARSKPFRTELDIDRIKGEHICVVCEQEGDDLVVCMGPCISAFHVHCLPPNSNAVETQNEAWLCPNCKNKTHACFHCKRTGIEMLADDTPATTSSESIKRPVRKCRALSCGKFYHQECITQFPLARIAINTHFICPLHTCAGCNQSGAQQEAISSKLIVCPKHGGGLRDTEDRKECSSVENEGKVAMKNTVYKHVSDVQVRQTENEDEVMSEASVVSVSSARKKEKKEKREKRDKKKKKKKKKKDKHSGHDNRDEEGGGTKRKRSKIESLEASGSSNCERADVGSLLTPSSRRTGLTVATSSVRSAEARSSRSPTSSLALFESPTTATKRIQERLEEALGQSDDDGDDSDASMCSPSLKKKRSSYHKSSKQRDVRSMPRSANWVVKEERSGFTGTSSMMDQYGASEAAKFLVSSSPVPVSPSGDRDSSAAQSSAEEDTSRSKGKHKKEILKSPSSSAVIPSSSSVVTASLVLQHIPSEDDDDDDEGAAESATSPANATLRTGKASGYSKKRRRNKAKREVQRVQRRVSSEEEEEEEGNEAKWVQCDSCKKWRTVPRDFDLDAMPKHWYCNMNTWDAQFASCAVAEEVVKTNPSPQEGKRRYKLKNSKSAACSAGDDGGYSSSGSGSWKRCGGSFKKWVSDMTVQEEKDKSFRSKNKDKTTKKRKITKQLKEKYREVKWVQCESTQCGKWRIVPTSIDFDRLPAVWYCHLNTWAPDLAKCSAPNPTEVDVFLLKQAQKESRPSKKATRVSSSTGDVASAISVSIASVASSVQMSDAGIDIDIFWPGNAVSIMEGAKNGNSNNVDGGGAGQSTKGRGGRGYNNNGSGNSSGIKKTVLEWAQCEKCNKWRKLPQHIKSSTLPDKWYCSMNHWDSTHAKCSVPEEADQEPLPLPPHPGSQWHKGGHKSQRPRRGKLSYSELLYGSTGQLRKAYTGESSILSFEYEGVTYHRDGQYEHSSMYVSPAAMEAAATMAGMDLRRRRSVSELFNAVNSGNVTSATAPTGLASLAVVTAALGQLEHRGLVVKVTELPEDSGEDEPSRAETLFHGAFSMPTHYRKVPTRPLKASKFWKFGTNVVALSPVKDS
ncbi:unnamed protein product [Peronospora destructor]|uniref:Uncharacterized protein n=1 Tax=Peronospora destructor TaxID=86335 RepID=A0AAV0T9H7_9STRA|nr:unnamed protein product [Peronospora destructor]